MVCAFSRAMGYQIIDALSAPMFFIFRFNKAYGTHLGVMVIRNAIADKLGNSSALILMKPIVKKWFVPAGPIMLQVVSQSVVAGLRLILT